MVAGPALDRDAALAILTAPAVDFSQVSQAGVSLGDALRERRQDSVVNMDRSINQLIVASLFALTMIVTIGVVTALALRREVLRPLDHLGDEARTVASGHFDHEVIESGPSEIRALARDIEAMRRQILTELQESQRSRSEAETRAIDLFRKLSLPDPETIGQRYPHQVSGGQLQRVMTAMALRDGTALEALAEPVWTSRTELRAFYSGHSLSDGVPEVVEQIARARGQRLPCGVA